MVRQQSPPGGRADDAVGLETLGRLETAYRLHRVRAVDAVDRDGTEARLAEGVLDLADVLA
jgi:hypothetical protein